MPVTIGSVKVSQNSPGGAGGRVGGGSGAAVGGACEVVEAAVVAWVEGNDGVEFGEIYLDSVRLTKAK